MSKIKKLKPDTPSRRYMSISSFEDITTNKPERKLTVALRKTGGRNNFGRITSRRRGGGHRRRYRIIDFKRIKFDVKGNIISIEYDPNRSSRIALVEYKDKERRYILAADGMKVGDTVMSSLNNKIPFKVGNNTSMKNIPEGLSIHNIELKPLKGAQLARSAGTYAKIMAPVIPFVTEKIYANLKQKSNKESIHL